MAVQLSKVERYLNFIKAEHTLFSLPVVLSGYLFACSRGNLPVDRCSLALFVNIVLAAIGGRVYAMSINRIIDVNIDRLNPRTKYRELPSLKIHIFEGWIIAALGLVVYEWYAYKISMLCFALSPCPVFAFTVYPLLKRFSALAHFGVGLSLALAPVGAWIAVTDSLSGLSPALLLFLFTFFWVSGFDIIYSTLDFDFDSYSGLHSLPVKIGVPHALRVSAILHFLAFLPILIIYLVYFRSILSLLCLITCAMLLYFEQRKAYDVNLAFFKINILVGFAIFSFIISGIYGL